MINLKPEGLLLLHAIVRRASSLRRLETGSHTVGIATLNLDDPCNDPLGVRDGAFARPRGPAR